MSHYHQALLLEFCLQVLEHWEVSLSWQVLRDDIVPVTQPRALRADSATGNPLSLPSLSRGETLNQAEIKLSVRDRWLGCAFHSTHLKAGLIQSHRRD